MEIKAYARFIRIAPRKVRLVTNLVKGKPAVLAVRQLQFLNKAAALPVRKLIQSAIANATHNAKLESAALIIKSITADGGPILKRIAPRARGSAAPIRKRTTHISVVLTDNK